MEKAIFKKIGVTVLLYSILVFAGGVMGFATKKSLPSLLAGGTFGLALLFSSVKVLTFRRWGLYASLILLLLLDAFFSYRFLLTQALFPAGMMLIVTTATLILLLFQLRTSKSDSQRFPN
ncbi:TMEM14 family protein [Candidatus Neptunochlamydia vexilliferae]|uniref:TMEM14 family protein n=1 Tax=Candidatus Neptunichlamydia vexilliferae TaxID=1651774 RepID=UPI001891CF3E|nr:TMEM14 family protein [Candidatus Neptunochlamydia vexilliferae]